MEMRANPFRRACIATMFALAMVGCSGVSAPSASGPPPPAGGTGFGASASTQVWLRQFGTGTVLTAPPAITPTTGLFHNGDVLTGVAADPAGNAIVCGYTRGAFPGYTNPTQSPQDFVAKFSPTGEQLWLRQFGTGATDYLNAVATDADGNIFAGGFTTGAFANASNPSGAPQAVVVKFDANGNRLWLRQFPAGTGIAVRALSAGSGGTLLVAGALDQHTAPSQGGAIQLLAQTAFVSQLDGATGGPLWQHTVAPATISILNAIAGDSAGNALVVGEAIQDATPPSTSTSFQLLAIKLAATDGAQVWQQENIQNSSSASAALLTGAAVDSQDNLVAVGSEFSNSETFCLLAKLDGSSGQPIWTTPFGTGTLTVSGTVVIAPSGNIYTTGSTNAALAPAFQSDLQDVYVGKFAASGQSQWVQQFGTGQETVAAGEVTLTVGPLPQGYWPQIATDPGGNVLVGGVTRGQFPGFSNPRGAVEPFLAKFGP